MRVSRPSRIMQNTSAGLPSFLWALGKNIFSWIWVLPEFSYCVCRIKVSVSLMAVNWRTCLAPRGLFLGFVHGHRSQKHQRVSYPSLTAVTLTHTFISSSTFKDTCEYIGTTWINQDYVHISSSLISNLNSI